MGVSERRLLTVIQSEMEGNLVGIWHLGKSENLRVTGIPRKAGNRSGVERVGRTDRRRRKHAFLRKERATDREPMSASERDRKTGRELMLTNKPKETTGRPLSRLPIMEAR